MWNDAPRFVRLYPHGVNEVFRKRNGQGPLSFSLCRNVQTIEDSVGNELAGDQVRLQRMV